jgi:uncharacterized protein
MAWLQHVVAAVFALFGAACVGSLLLSLPGTWIMLAAAVIIELADALYLDPAGPRQTFSWWVLGSCTGLALLGELIELLAGAAGTKAGGGTRRGMIGAIIGGILGVLVLTPVLSVVLPVVGTIFGVLLGALLGTFIGAVVGEIGAEQATLRGTIRPAIGATIGRVCGTVAKVAVAVVVWLTLSVDAFWR